MNTINEKRTYNFPQLQRVILDNDISLILESSPPAGPDEGYLKVPDYFNNDPFKTNLG